MILVTGATSRSGSAILRRFAEHKHPVRALVRDRSRAQALEGLPGVELVTGDMLRPETLGPALEGVERALLLSRVTENLLETHATFIDTAKRAGVRQIVKYSGAESGIGFDPLAFRGTREHEQAERYLMASGVAWTILRPSQFMQMYLLEAPTIASEGAIYLPLGEAELAPIDIEDVASVAHALLRSGGHEGMRYDMTGPEALRMDQIAQRIGEAIDKPVRYVDVSLDEYREKLLQRGMEPRGVALFTEIAAERRRRPKSRIAVDTQARFGVRPTAFAEFARRHADAFRLVPR
jgi:uncharacterized protein YbjT (DUF2867 family)